MRARAGLFDPTLRPLAILREVIDALRLVGILLTIAGGLVTAKVANPRNPFTPTLALVTLLVTVPGLLYVIASIGLTRRRYWAWVMSFAVSVLLLLALLVTFTLITLRNPGGALVFIPGVLFMSMPGLILLYMLRALPVLREAEMLSTKGFAILPARRHDDDDDDDDNNLAPPTQ